MSSRTVRSVTQPHQEGRRRSPESESSDHRPTDIADSTQIQEGSEEFRDTFDPVDVLINNVVTGKWKGLLDIKISEFDHTWEVNARGALLCPRVAVDDMLETGGGTVIFSGATSSVQSRSGAIDFTAPKFAARGIAMDIAQEFGPKTFT